MTSSNPKWSWSCPRYTWMQIFRKTLEIEKLGSNKTINIKWHNRQSNGHVIEITDATFTWRG